MIQLKNFAKVIFTMPSINLKATYQQAWDWILGVDIFSRPVDAPEMDLPLYQQESTPTDILNITSPSPVELNRAETLSNVCDSKNISTLLYFCISGTPLSLFIDKRSYQNKRHLGVS